MIEKIEEKISQQNNLLKTIENFEAVLLNNEGILEKSEIEALQKYIISLQKSLFKDQLTKSSKTLFIQ